MDPQHASGLATLFLVGAVVSRLFFGSRFYCTTGQFTATLGF